MPHRFIVCIRLLLAAILALLAFTGSVPPTTRAAAPPEYFLADAGDAQALDWLQSSGAVQINDYGAFSLWELASADSAGRSNEVESARPDGLRPSSVGIQLRDITLSTGLPEPEPALPESLRQQALAGDGFWLVQFVGPTLEPWLDALRAAGLEVVAYLPENAYILWGPEPSARLSEIKEIAGLVRWQGAYHPAYRLHPALRSIEAVQPGEIDVIVQVYDTPALQETIARLEALSSAAPTAPQGVLNLTNLRLRIPAGQLADLASWADVFNVEPYSPPQLLDEIQGQVLAGNITISGGLTTASAPGYLAWLNSKGFSTNPADYPIVDVIDDGIDIGDAANVQHPDFYVLGSKPGVDRVAYIANCSKDVTGNAVGGHGNLNAGIISGYNNLTGFPYENAAGYQYGLGISPYGSIAGTKMFPNDGSAPDLVNCSGSDTVMIQNAYQSGARITSDSWGAKSAGAYNVYAQIYDTLTRDASSAGGNQSMLHVFAAGNDGSPLNPPPAPQSTINSPGSAKNVLTIGATENPRDNTVSCNLWTNADNADDIAPYSSRGRTADGRTKPDIVAPGTHVQGPASQDPGYTGTFVCPPKNYPAGQTLYAWSSGTSHSTPAVAGGAQLVYEYYKRVLAPGQNPSPAMLKALMINSPRYLTGLDANDTLPGTAQGWGMLDLGRLFDAAPRMLTDQTTLLTATGQVYSVTASVVDPTKPLRVSVVWTDTPGSTASGGKALVNDLDLEVSMGGTVYKGNVFSGALSTAGGAADSLNNVENVFLPAGTLGNLQVRVIARNLAGDGVPGVGTTTDQDFALVIYNATGELIPNLSVSAVRRYTVVGNLNSSLEPGETVDLEIDLTNMIGSAAALGVSASLSVSQGTASVLQANSGYPDLPPDGAARTNLARFRVAVDPSQLCGGLLSLALTVTYTGGEVTFYLPEIMTALTVQSVQTYTAGGLPLQIPDRVGSNPAVPVLAPVVVGQTSPIVRLSVNVNISHSFVGDLILNLVAPNGDVLVLASRRGSTVDSSDHYANVIFEDSAARAITSSSGPFSGSYRPQQPLSTFNGRVPGGTWNLQVSDHAPNDTGTVNAFSLTITHAVCTAHTVVLSPIFK